MNKSYRQAYFVAFNTNDEVICHHADKTECAKLAQSMGTDYQVVTATRMTDEALFNTLEATFTAMSTREHIDLMTHIGFEFCGKLAYQCNGYLFDNYGSMYKRIDKFEIRLTQ